jgi:small subunit ribosomal protein S1
VRVRDGLEGLIHISELSQARVTHPSDVVREGQSLKLKIISLDSERHRLGLSLKQAEEPPARPAPEPGAPAAASHAGPAPSSGAPRQERRPRPERSYSMSDAVQEPEGGIDNTLASAFAQVRQQLAAAEVDEVEEIVAADEASTEEAAAEAIEAVVEGVAATESAQEAEAAEEVEQLADAAAASDENAPAAVEAAVELVEEVAATEEAEEAAAAETIEEIADTVAADEATEEASAEEAVEGIAEETMEANTKG